MKQQTGDFSNHLVHLQLTASSHLDLHPANQQPIDRTKYPLNFLKFYSDVCHNVVDKIRCYFCNYKFVDSASEL